MFSAWIMVCSSNCWQTDFNGNFKLSHKSRNVPWQLANANGVSRSLQEQPQIQAKAQCEGSLKLRECLWCAVAAAAEGDGGGMGRSRKKPYNVNVHLRKLPQEAVGNWGRWKGREGGRNFKQLPCAPKVKPAAGDGRGLVGSVQFQVQTAAKTFKWNFCVKVLSGKLRPTALGANKLA